MSTASSELSVRDSAVSRVSIRRYTDEAVTPEQIRDVVDIARRAPSPYNIQPWRVVAVTDPETKERLKAAAYGQPQVGAAPVVFVIYTDMQEMLDTVEETVHPGMGEEAKVSISAQLRGDYGRMPDEARAGFGRGQGCTFMGYLLLAAQSLGYGTSPMLGFDPAQVKEILGLPAHTEIPALVSMGRPAEDGFPQYRHEVDRILRIV